ncbi:PepSY-associated TM helix domain-containing protein [Sporocytophaga myxococcoides]|uniref:PepSY-associated TM helix domain-containing protein n=1 Tax=Sporocytophaga myxococcoides TaxID=153721 RepID=UPI00041619CF|nr:PepSY-associated TM helix domain-containing protein [Sporocytophaga myxococcoides]
MSIKKNIKIIHRWLGFISGLVVFIVALTGAIYAFEEEISDLIYPYQTIPIQKAPEISIETIKEACSPYLDHINAIYFEGKGRPIAVREIGKNSNGQRYNKYLYLNPYTAEVVHKKFDNSKSFFDIVIGLHINLLLGDVGSYIVKYGTLIFLIILLSGIYLWWPKNKKGVKQRFTLDWKNSTKWKRKNFDLHTVLGFYASVFVLFAAITGLAWTFDWMDKAIYATATFGKPYKTWEETLSVSDTLLHPISSIEDLVMDKAIKDLNGAYISKRFYIPSSTTEAFRIYFTPEKGTNYKDILYYYDQRTGRLLKKETPEDKNNGEYLRDMYYDIHVGQLLGFPGRVAMFFACLITASLPVTGFIIWWGRRNKKNRTSNKSSSKSRPSLQHN